MPAIDAGRVDVRDVQWHAALPWRGFLVDCLLAAVLLIGLSLLFIVPIVMLHVGNQTVAGSRIGAQAALAAALPAITVAAIVAMLVAAVLTWWLRGRSLVGPLVRMAAMPAYGLAIAAGIVIQLGAQSLGWLLAQSGAGMQPSNAQPLIALFAAAPWVAWLMVVIVGPFAEELLMRHVLLRRFAVAGHAAIGLVLTSVVFALLHEPAPRDAGVAAWLGGLATYGGMGAAFALVYLRTGRFRAAFLAHAACNAAALVVAAYSAS
ncbi:MAG: hypothetical protein DCF27_06530 [Lysobacteraceae bacterium]|nr:MAG: hypothetical protein DCF27_06530 [Xanthomonadaceae bacterium]